MVQAMTDKPTAQSEDQLKVLRYARDHPDATPSDIEGALDDEHIGVKYVERILHDFELPEEERQAVDETVATLTGGNDTDDDPADADETKESDDRATDDLNPMSQALSVTPDPDAVRADRSIEYECSLCGEKRNDLGSIQRHVTSSEDYRHKDRHGTDPGAINVLGNDALNELNQRRAEADEDTLMDQLDFHILWTIARYPDRTQKFIAEQLGETQSKVSFRLREMGVDWQNRQEVVESLFPEIPMAEADQETEDKPDSDESDEVVQKEVGNRSYSGPSKGVDTTSGEPPSTLAETIQERKKRKKLAGALLDSWDTRTAKQQAVLLGHLANPNITKGGLAQYADVDTTYPGGVLKDPEESGDGTGYGDLRDKLADAIDDGLLSLNQLYHRMKDSPDHNPELLKIEQLAEAVEPEPPDTEPVEQEQSVTPTEFEQAVTPDATEAADRATDDLAAAHLALTEEEAFELLTAAGVPERIKRRLYAEVSNN